MTGYLGLTDFPHHRLKEPRKGDEHRRQLIHSVRLVTHPDYPHGGASPGGGVQRNSVDEVVDGSYEDSFATYYVL